MTKSFSSAAEAEHHANQAREDLAKTLGDLRDNLSPRRLASNAIAKPRQVFSGAVAATRESTPDWLTRFWVSARSPAGLGLIGASAASVAVTIMRRRSR